MVKNPYANAGDMRLRFVPWVRKIPWRKAWQPTPVFLPGKSHDRGAWQVAAHRVSKSWTQLNSLSMHANPFRCLPLKPEGSNTCKCVIWSLRGDGVSHHQSFLLCSKSHCHYLPSVSGQLVSLPAACVSVNLITSIMVSAFYTAWQ